MSRRRNPADLIAAAIHNTLESPKQGPTYFIRPAGSFVQGQTRDKSDAAGGADIAEWLLTLTWREITDNVRAMGAGFGQVRYFQATSDRPAYEGVRLWGELTAAERMRVRVAESFHRARDGSVRYELVSDLAPKLTPHISIAIGSSAGPMEAPTLADAVVYTWFPGRITPMVEIGPDALDGPLDPNATVKADGVDIRANRGRRNPKLSDLVANEQGLRLRDLVKKPKKPKKPATHRKNPTTQILALCQPLLAELTAIRDLARQLHWNSRSYGKHLGYEKISEMAAEQLDDLAEALLGEYDESDLNIGAINEVASSYLVGASGSVTGLYTLIAAANQRAHSIDQEADGAIFGLKQVLANIAVALQKMSYLARVTK